MSQNPDINRFLKACRDILTIAPRVDDAIERMVNDQRGQPRSPSTEPGHAPGSNSPVENALAQRCDGETNLARIKQIIRHAPDIEQFVRLIRAELPHTSDAAARAATSADPGLLCEHENCHDHSRNVKPTTVGGRLKNPIVLCPKHYAWIARTRDPMRR